MSYITTYITIYHLWFIQIPEENIPKNVPPKFPKPMRPQIPKDRKCPNSTFHQPGLSPAMASLDRPRFTAPRTRCWSQVEIWLLGSAKNRIRAQKQQFSSIFQKNVESIPRILLILPLKSVWDLLCMYNPDLVLDLQWIFSLGFPVSKEINSTMCNFPDGPSQITI